MGCVDFALLGFWGFYFYFYMNLNYILFDLICWMCMMYMNHGFKIEIAVLMVVDVTTIVITIQLWILLKLQYWSHICIVDHNLKFDMSIAGFFWNGVLDLTCLEGALVWFIEFMAVVMQVFVFLEIIMFKIGLYSWILGFSSSTR